MAVPGKLQCQATIGPPAKRHRLAFGCILRSAYEPVQEIFCTLVDMYALKHACAAILWVTRLYFGLSLYTL